MTALELLLDTLVVYDRRKDVYFIPARLYHDKLVPKLIQLVDRQCKHGMALDSYCWQCIADKKGDPYVV